MRPTLTTTGRYPTFMNAALSLQVLLRLLLLPLLPAFPLPHQHPMFAYRAPLAKPGCAQTRVNGCTRSLWSGNAATTACWNHRCLPLLAPLPTPPFAAAAPAGCCRAGRSHEPDVPTLPFRNTTAKDRNAAFSLFAHPPFPLAGSGADTLVVCLVGPSPCCTCEAAPCNWLKEIGVAGSGKETAPRAPLRVSKTLFPPVGFL